MHEEPTVLDAVIELEKIGADYSEYLQEKIAKKLNMAQRGWKATKEKAKTVGRAFSPKAIKEDVAIAAGRTKKRNPKWLGLRKNKPYTKKERAKAGLRAAGRASPYAAGAAGAGYAGYSATRDDKKRRR